MARPPKSVARGRAGETILRGPTDFVASVAVSPRGARLAATDWKGVLHVYALDPPGPLWSAPAHSHRAEGVAFLGEDLLATSGHDGRIALWRAADGEPVRRFAVDFGPDHDGPPLLWGLVASPDGRHLAVATSCHADLGDWLVYDLASPGRPPLRLERSGAPAFEPGGAALLSPARGALTQVELGSGRRRPAGAVPPDAGLVALAPDGRLALSWLADDGCHLELRPPGRGPAVRCSPGRYTYLAPPVLSPDGRLAAFPGAGKGLLRRVEGDRPLRPAPAHGGRRPSPDAAAFTPDGRTLCTGGWDRTVRLWPLPVG